MKKCQFCNAELEDNAVKCDYCGMDIPAEAPAEQAAPGAEEQPQTIADIKPVIKETPMVKKRRKNPWWAKTLCVLLSICLFFSLFTGVSFSLVRYATNGGIVKAVTKDVDIFDVPITADGGTVADMMADTLNGFLGNKSEKGGNIPQTSKPGTGIVLCGAASFATGTYDASSDMAFEAVIGDVSVSEGAIAGELEDILGGITTDGDAVGGELEDIFEGITADGEITAEQVKQIANDLGLNEVLGEVLNEVTGALAGEKVNLTSDKILDVVKKNQAVIEEKLGVTITDEHYAKAAEVLDKELVNVNQQINQVVEKPELQVTLKTVSFVVGPTIPIIAYAVSGVIVLIMLLLLRRKESTFIFSGIPALLVGLCFLTAFLCSDIVADLALSYLNTMGEAAATYTALAQTLIKAVIDPMLTAALITMGAGVLFIVLYIVLKTAIGKSKKYAK